MSTGQAPVAARSSDAAAASPSSTGLNAWHGLIAAEACSRLGVDPGSGLTPAEVETRRAQVGPN
jgi:cation transport ATPase-like protein